MTSDLVREFFAMLLFEEMKGFSLQELAPWKFKEKKRLRLWSEKK